MRNTTENEALDAVAKTLAGLLLLGLLSLPILGMFAKAAEREAVSERIERIEERLDKTNRLLELHGYYLHELD